VIALSEVAVQIAEVGELGLRFDAFGDDEDA